MNWSIENNLIDLYRIDWEGTRDSIAEEIEERDMQPMWFDPRSQESNIIITEDFERIT